MATNDLMFDENFIVKELNPDGKKFMMVDRVNCVGEVENFDLILDIHSELFKLENGSKFRMSIVPTFREDGLPDDDEYDPKASILYILTFRIYDLCFQMTNRMLDRFEYAMSGQVYRIEGAGKDQNQVTVFASYGGLLMRLRGEQLNMGGFKDDGRLYLMLKKLHD